MQRFCYSSEPKVDFCRTYLLSGTVTYLRLVLSENVTYVKFQNIYLWGLVWIFLIFRSLRYKDSFGFLACHSRDFLNAFFGKITFVAILNMQDDLSNFLGYLAL